MRLAQLISTELESLWGRRDMGRRSVAILRETRMPSVQVEPPADLGGHDHAAVADRIAAGVERFLDATVAA
jgi:hypothetical protein